MALSCLQSEFLDPNRFARKHQKDGSICRSEGGSESFFAHLPRIACCEPLYLRNRAIFAFERTTSSYVSSDASEVGKKTLFEPPSSKF